jgi:hypothetical protein
MRDAESEMCTVCIPKLLQCMPLISLSVVVGKTFSLAYCALYNVIALFSRMIQSEWSVRSRRVPNRSKSLIVKEL